MRGFSEDLETAKKAIDRGMLISLSGIVTFKNTHQLHEVAAKIPLEYLLLETDSPFLAPVPHRGKKNHPAYTRYVAEAIAKLKGISWQEVADQTTKNFLDLTQTPLLPKPPSPRTVSSNSSTTSKAGRKTGRNKS